MFYLDTIFSRNLIWHLFCLIVFYVDKVVIISIADTTFFIALSFNKYSSMTEWYVWGDDSFICDFIKSLSRLTALGWVLYKSEYLIFLCFGLNNGHPSSFIDVIEGEVNVETDEIFDV